MYTFLRYVVGCSVFGGSAYIESEKLLNERESHRNHTYADLVAAQHKTHILTQTQLCIFCQTHYISISMYTF